MSTPDTFRCGHPRTSANTRVKNDYATCRACGRAKENAYRQQVGRKKYESPPYSRRLLREAAAAKPHLYPTQQKAA